MTRWIYKSLVLVLLVGVGIWGWRALFPSAEKVIKKRLNEVAQLASFGSNEAPLAKLSNTQQLLGHFASEVEINIDVPGRSMQTVTGTEDLRQALMAARRNFSAMSVEFLDIGVTVMPDSNSATASTTVRARISSEKDAIVQEMKFSFNKIQGDWLIRRIDTVNTLR